MVLRIGKFRAGVWVLLLTATVLMAALYKMKTPSGENVLWAHLPGILAGLAAVIAVYFCAARVTVRAGVIAAALLAGNFAFLEAARGGMMAPELGLLAMQCWLFWLCRRVASHSWLRLGIALGFLFALSFAATRHPLLAERPVFPTDWRGSITSAIGGTGALLWLAGIRKNFCSKEAALWGGVLLWGGFNLIALPDKLVMTLPAAALFGGWLLDNCDHRRVARLVGGGVLLALRLLPVLILGLWLFTWYAAQDRDLAVPLRLPLIILAVLVLVDWLALRYFKFTDRRLMVVVIAAGAIALWQIMLVEPMRMQQGRSVIPLHLDAPASQPENADELVVPELRETR